MTSKRSVVLIGNGPILAIARAIASGDGTSSVTAIELSPERIPDADIAVLIGYPPSDVDVFAAVGLHALNHARSDLVGRINDAGFRSASMIHPTAVIAASSDIGANSLVATGATVGPDCVLGEGCVVLDGARIEAGARVGRFGWIGANVVIGFGASVGAHSILRPGVHLDAGVPVGHHCELSTSGIRQAAIPDGVFETSTFASARIYVGGAR